MWSALLAAALLAQAGVQLPDLAKGEINGKKAVLVWPRFDRKLIEPVGCSVHLVPLSNFDTELVFPCGVWFQPPPDTYRIWLEQQDLVSPLHNLLVYSGGPFTGRGLGAVFDVIVGGRVHLSPAVKLTPENQLRLLHLDSHLHLGTFGRSFERRVGGTKAHQPVLMPAGRIIAVTTDHRGDALAVSKPIVVPKRQAVSVLPSPPEKGSDVLVVLNRPRVAGNETKDAVEMALDLGGRSVRPDVFVTAADRVYGVWYGIDAQEAVLEVSSSTLSLEPERLKIRPGQVLTVRRTLKILPSVNVSILAPDGAFETLERKIDFIRRDGRAVRQVTFKRSTARAEYLPAEPLRVFLKVGPWRFVREVDLTSSEDQDVIFDLKPILLRGTVYRGRDPAPGTIRFYLGEEWLSTTADEQGRYEITLWEPRMYVVEIDLTSDQRPPFRDYFVEVRHTQSRDFHIPDSRYVVRVTDAASGKGIAGAEVSALNKFQVNDGPEQTTSQQTVTNEKAEALLPPLRTGSVAVLARAKGYLESKPITVPVIQEADGDVIAISLRAEGPGTELTLRLFTGSPAAAAEIIAVATGRGNDPLWRSSADENGRVTIPENLAGAILIVKHPGAACLARIWNTASTTWGLAPVASPLTVKVVDGTGETVRFAHILLWVDGIALGGDALRFLADSTPVSDGSGYWRTRNLGGQTYQIVAVRQPGMVIPQSLAHPLPVPWRDEVEIRVVH